MPKICYKDKNFPAKTLALIQTAEDIIDEYTAQGFDLTLRQLYYQFVARDLLPNTVKSYNMLGSTINDARLAGLIDWNAIIDRTRGVERNSHWNSPAEIVSAVAWEYQIDKWEGQDRRVEVWIEKDALKGVISGICEELDVPYFSCRGYVSQSEMWQAGHARMSSNSETLVLHLGDHDPSGIDMTRDINDRLYIFSRTDVEIKRIALNMDQVEEYDPPPNPAKLTDSRIGYYLAAYGNESWELDALEPRVLVELIRSEVEAVRDPEQWQAMVERQEEHREKLTKAAIRLMQDE